MNTFQTARTHMVESQIRTNGVINEKILQAFETIPREHFVPDTLKTVAYTDKIVPINKERILLDPMTHARLLQAIAPQPHEIALDIGASSGYGAAILSSMVTTVLALENRPATIEKASKLLNKLDVCNVVYVQGKLSAGYSDEAPYDIIMINGAVASVPEALLNQLSETGRLTAIEKETNSSQGRAVLYHALGNGQYSKQILFESSVPYILGFEPEENFVF